VPPQLRAFLPERTHGRNVPTSHYAPTGGARGGGGQSFRQNFNNPLDNPAMAMGGGMPMGMMGPGPMGMTGVPNPMGGAPPGAMGYRPY
jgi:hypothetical protein